MKTGIELITDERNIVQIEKYGFTGKHHADHTEWYEDGQLIYASEQLMFKNISTNPRLVPKNWDLDWWKHLCLKSHKERLIISGALIAAELDRLIEIEDRNKEYDTKGKGY